MLTPSRRARLGRASPLLLVAFVGAMLALDSVSPRAPLERSFVGEFTSLEVAATVCGGGACAADTPHVGVGPWLDGVDHGGGSSLEGPTARLLGAAARGAPAPRRVIASRSLTRDYLTYRATAPPRAA